MPAPIHTHVVMEVHSLRITVTEQDLNALAKKIKAGESPIENPEVRIAPEGVTVKGVYPMFVNVSFETQWELAITDGNVTVKLLLLRAMGMPGNIFKSVLMKVIADAAKDKPGFRIDEDTIVIDLDTLLKAEGIDARTRLSALDCQAGQITLTAGS